MASLESHLLLLIKHFLGAVSYPGIFILMTIEGFGIPIPSELTMPFSGFLASSAGGNKFSLLPVIVAGSLGEITGGVIAYALGHKGGRPALERYGRFVMVSTDELESAERWFARYGDWVVLITRLLPAIRSFIAFPAGVVRMPFWRFFIYGVIGSTIWCIALALLGHELGKHWQSVSTGLRKYDVIIVIVVVALIAFAVYKRVAHVRSRTTEGEGEVRERIAE